MMTIKEQFPDYETVEYHLVYAELIKAARHRGTVTYQELAHVVGLPSSGNHMAKRLGEILGAISQNEFNHKRPLLSAVAVRTDGHVGPGFFKIPHDNKILTSGSPEDEARFVEEQVKQLYDIWTQKFAK